MPMIAATNATNTSPSRNMVAVIRTVSPRSGAYLVRAAMTTPPFGPGWLCRRSQQPLKLVRIYPYNAGCQLNVTREYALGLRSGLDPGRLAWDEPFVGEHLADLVHARILVRKDQVRRLKSIRGQR